MGGVRKSMGENVKQEERGRTGDFRSLQFTQRLRDYKIKRLTASKRCFEEDAKCVTLPTNLRSIERSGY